MLLTSAPSRIIRPFCQLLVAGAFLCRLQAQSPQSFLKGKVLDPTRAPIAGAKATAIPKGGTSGPSAVSDQNGEFYLPLEPGKYTLRVSKDGFNEASQPVSVPQSRSGPNEISEPHEIVLQVAP